MKFLLHHYKQPTEPFQLCLSLNIIGNPIMEVLCGFQDQGCNYTAVKQTFILMLVIVIIAQDILTYDDCLIVYSSNKQEPLFVERGLENVKSACFSPNKQELVVWMDEQIIVFKFKYDTEDDDDDCITKKKNKWL